MAKVFTFRASVILIDVIGAPVLVLDDAENDIEVSMNDSNERVGEIIRAWVNDTIDTGKED